jgi:hypothetical protein
MSPGLVIEYYPTVKIFIYTLNMIVPTILYSVQEVYATLRVIYLLNKLGVQSNIIYTYHDALLFVPLGLGWVLFSA